MSAITRFLPKNHLSYLMGKVVHARLPKWFWKPITYLFAKYYKINLDEASKPLGEYASLGDFFVRDLKEGVRPIGKSEILHPADSVVTQAEIIKKGKLIQAKGKFYSLNDFIFNEQASVDYEDGFFVTYYLCPTDYHQVHSPVDGVITKITHIPGQLWPVNKWSTDNIEELFSINERVVVEIETEKKQKLQCVFVGATNVGFIEIFCCPEVQGNQLKVFKPKIYNLKHSVKKGEKLGQFRMGSTVVMVYPKGLLPDTSILYKNLNQPVRVNSDFFTPLYLDTRSSVGDKV